MRIVIEAMKAINSAYPDIRFHLYSGNDEDVSERLDNGLVDFGLFVGDTDIDKYDYIKLPTKDIWGLLIREDCKLADKKSVTPNDIATVPILCSRQALRSNELSGWLGYDFSKLHIVSTHNLINNAALMVKAGMGCALTVENLFNTAQTDLTFRPLEPEMQVNIYFAWKKYQVFSKCAELLLKRLQEILLI